MGSYGTYWFNGPNGWYKSTTYKGNPSAYTWQETPMGRAEANIASLKAEYEKAFNEAKQANEQRYAEILGGFDTLYDDTMSGLEGMGDQARKDIGISYDKAYSQSLQGLVNAGMANSTIVPSVALGNARRRSDAINSLNETLRREKLGYMNSITGDKLSFMERREDSYPDANMYASLINSYGNYMGNIGYASSQPAKNKSYSYWG
ncbi:MAG: hypothetical protein JW912_07560 [Sedimentisphaerales bacterium]|nr:hypothetical protein [Sedimentisphaerales bacterium]